MSIDSQSNNKRIAKNTLMLYLRTIFVMVISLYTSRIVLQALGIDNYGIYNVVGGVVGMFSVISGALSNSISRFITFELGKGDKEKLTKIFSTSINIQLAISLLVILLGETLGSWFLNYKMNIPAARLYAANWVLQCSLLAFVINLISVPYNAAIIAHEKMSAFAYVSILEVSLKLIIVYMLYMSPWDKLITYSVLLVCVSTIIRFTYSIYCNKHFEETRYKVVHDKALVKDMTGFAGWSFFTNAFYIFNTQGVNILINLFFGVGLNAARGVAAQVEQAVMKFVNDFTTAVNPQITKNYAQGNIDEMFKLVCRGAKFSTLLLYFIALPIIMEADYIMQLWLKNPPENSVAFVQLTFFATIFNQLGNTGYTACMATGKIKKYVLIISTIGCLSFPLTYIAFKLGSPAVSTYIIFSIVYATIDVVRLFLMKQMLGFPPILFVKNVVLKCLVVIIPSFSISFVIKLCFSDTPIQLQLVIVMLSCILSSLILTYLFGLDKSERLLVYDQIKRMINRI